MKRKLFPFLAVCMALLLCLTACSQSNQNNSSNSITDSATEDTAPGPEPFTVGVRIGQAQDTLDPAYTTAQGGETILYHLYENLMRWEDDGSGYAVLAPGQAESYTLETDYAGNATYTFTLRQDIFWSDGEPVTALDFVNAWQRLADPAAASPHSVLLQKVAGYDAVQKDGNASLLAVSAPDDTTFVVTLNGSCAWFLDEVCAGAYTMPVRTDLMKSVNWKKLSDDTVLDEVVTNGPYVLSHFGSDSVTLLASDSYYAPVPKAPDSIYFSSVSDVEADYEEFLSEGSTTGLITELPSSVLQELSDSGTWLPEAATSTYAVLFNTQAPPFDQAEIRQAFYLAIDPNAVVDAAGDLTLRPATGLVPCGVSDYGPRREITKDTSTAALPDPNAIVDPNAPDEAEEPASYWDFRAHSQELLTQPEESSYAANCQKARALMAQAGYAGGGGFPIVEYIYVESEQNRAFASALQSMWRDQLGVTVTIRGLTQEEYDTMLVAPEPVASDSSETGAPPAPQLPPYQLAGQRFTARYSDAWEFLVPWHTISIRNVTGYSSEAYDILLNSAKAATSAEARDAYLHDAEAIVLTDAAVLPLCYEGGSYRLADHLTGLYRAPDGVYFLSALQRVELPSD